MTAIGKALKEELLRAKISYYIVCGSVIFSLIFAVVVFPFAISDENLIDSNAIAYLIPFLLVQLLLFRRTKRRLKLFAEAVAEHTKDIKQ
jgi:hypothetical protein